MLTAKESLFNAVITHLNATMPLNGLHFLMGHVPCATRGHLIVLPANWHSPSLGGACPGACHTRKARVLNVTVAEARTNDTSRGVRLMTGASIAEECFARF